MTHLPTDLPAGLTIDSSGQATVDKRLGEVLFDLALELEDSVDQPVDVEHVLGAILMGAVVGEIDSQTDLSVDNEPLLVLLRGQLRHLFDQHGGRLGYDEA